MEEVEDDDDDGDDCDEDDENDADDGDRGAELEADLGGKGNKTHVKHCLQCGQPIQQESEHCVRDQEVFKTFKIFFILPIPALSQQKQSQATAWLCFVFSQMSLSIGDACLDKKKYKS